MAAPSIKEVSERIEGAIESQGGGQSRLLPKSFTSVLSKALAGLHVSLYKMISWYSSQMFVRFASDSPIVIDGIKTSPLAMWGNLIGVPAKAEATRCELLLSVQTGTNATIKSGVLLSASDNGFTYSVKSAATIDGGGTLTVQCVNDPSGLGGYGADGNLPAGAELQFVNPISGVNTTATVIEQTVTAADEETTSSYRARIVTRFKQRPQGGAPVDYYEWGLEASGITAIYPYAAEAGVVEVYAESGAGIATDAQLAAVKAAIELDSSGLATRRPVNAFVDVKKMNEVVITITVNGLSNASIAGSVESAIDAYLSGRRPFISGLSVDARADYVSLSDISAAISSVVSQSGDTFNSASMRTGGGVFISNYALGRGEFCTSVVEYES